MSKSMLIDAVHAQLGGTKTDAAKAVEAVAVGIKGITNGGARIILPPLGTFTLKHKAERQARNPRTGEGITVAAHDSLHLKPSKRG